MDCDTLEAMAERRRPGVARRAPAAVVMRAAFMAVAGLPNPATIDEVAHWTDLTGRHAKRAMDRLAKAGLIEPAGRVVRLGRSLQTYRVAG